MNSILDLFFLLLLTCACATDVLAAQQPVNSEATPSSVEAMDVSANSTVVEPIEATPLVMEIGDRPIPFKGGDGRYHSVYELQLVNFEGGRVTVGPLQVLDAGTRVVVAEFSAGQVASRLVVRDHQAIPGEFSAAQLGILYLHVTSDSVDNIPRAFDHRLSMMSESGTFSPTAAHLRVDRPTQLVLDAPLRGQRYIAGDGCCDSVRHVRATLGVNGSSFDAQRFAIDWEQLDSKGRIYVGDVKDPTSYIIYGKPAYAVADARVIEAVDDLDNSPIGEFPKGLALDKADGNHVVLDLGDGYFALYAHFAPRSVQVHMGQTVRRGQVLGMVGTSGNSSEPHLHFQVTNGPSTFLSNGVPYLLRKFSATERGASTTAFDRAIIDGKPIQTVALPGLPDHEKELPLDLWITDLN